MRILHLPSSYLPDTLGGTETYVAQLVEGLHDLGHESAVAWHTETRALAPGSVALPPLRPPSLRALYARTTGHTAAGFEALLEKFSPDLLHFHAFTLGAGLDHAAAAQARGVPYIITFHTPAMSCARGTWLRYGETPCDGVLQPRTCAACSLQSRGVPLALSALLAQSRIPARLLPDGPWKPLVALPDLYASAFEHWRAFLGGAARIIACAAFVRDRLVANGIPQQRIEVLRQALKGPTRERTLRLPLQSNQPLRLGMFARLNRVKGPDLFLQAGSRLRASGLDIEVELAGPLESDDEAWIKRMLAEREPWARHVGTLRGDALTEWLDGLDLVAIPSRWFETGPLTLLEAWDRGVPVIGTDLGGIREFMHPVELDRLLFPLEDVEGMARAVRSALDWKGAAPSVTVPGMDELSAKVAAIYESVLS